MKRALPSVFTALLLATLQQTSGADVLAPLHLPDTQHDSQSTNPPGLPSGSFFMNPAGSPSGSFGF